MVEISSLGSGEGRGRETGPGYSTPLVANAPGRPVVEIESTFSGSAVSRYSLALITSGRVGRGLVPRLGRAWRGTSPRPTLINATERRGRAKCKWVDRPVRK